MAYNLQAVLDIALAEEGYLEKATLDQLDDKTANAGEKNYTKYARDLAAVSFFNGKKQGVAWCAVFVAWCFYTAYGKAAALSLLCQPSSGNCGAGCKSARGYFKAKGQLHDEPQPGDVVYFYSKDKSSVSHTGLVYAVDDTYLYTVEGNTSSDSGVVANGGAVARKRYKRSYDRLAGFGRPAYGDSKTVGKAAEAATQVEMATPEATGQGKDQTAVIQITANAVNARVGDGKAYASVGQLAQGTALEWVATAANGWHAGRWGKRVVWISPEFSAVGVGQSVSSM